MESTSALKTKAIIGNIRKIRERKHYLQVYVGEKLGITQHAYSKIELGYSKITLTQLVKIAGILEVDLAELIQLDTDENRNLTAVPVFSEKGEEQLV